MQVRTKKSQLAKLRNQMLRKSRFAAVLFDDGNNFVFDKSPRRLPHQFFFVVQLRIKINKIDAAVSRHASFLVSGSRKAADARRNGWRALRSATRDRFAGK